MSATLFNVSLPTQYRGSEEIATPENYDFAGTLVGRIDLNTRAIISAVRDQCVTSETMTDTLSTESDGSQLEEILWQG